MTTTEQPTPHRGSTSTPSLKLTDVVKVFGPIQVVKKLTLEIPRNEVVGLVGENGAGKSSLLKLITGVYQPDSGTIEVNGSGVTFRSPKDAVRVGIGVVHQEQSLLTNLSVAENLAMNAVSTKDPAIRFGFYRWGQLNREAAEILGRIGSTIDPRAKVADLSFVERQMVEIARAMRVDEILHASPLVILDEPTAVLERNETEILEREIRQLKQLGSVIFVSHRLDEVMRICDRILVMREGELVADRRTDSVTEDELFTLMVGRESRAVARPRDLQAERTAPVLEVQGLGRKGRYRDVTFSVVPGRTTAIVGSNGSGRESLSRAIFGAEPFDAGSLKIGGREVRAWSVPKAVKQGVAYVPSERKVEGMIGGLSAAENITLTHPGRSRVGPLLKRRARHAVADEWFERLDVRPREPKLELERFSGGNQQKVVMAKWLMAEQLKVLVLDHPLRGLDPGAAETVNDQIHLARDGGAAVVLLADTLEEALHMGDEILVMRDGEVTAHYDLSAESPTSLQLLEKMV